MRHIKIKLWNEDMESTKSTPPIFKEYWIVDGISKEDFRKIAREQLEEILDRWEKENEVKRR